MSAATGAAPLSIVDPHFHFWTIDRPNPNLGDIVESIPHYKAEHYASDLAAAGLAATAAVHVETVVGQCEGGAKLDEVSETEFVAAQGKLLPAGLKLGIVAYAHVARSDVEAVLDGHAARVAAAGGSARLVGVRMIVNHEPSWPQVSEDFLAGDKLKHGLDVLQSRGLTFDLQCNPHQLLDAAKLFAAYPTLTVVVNHLACPKLGRTAAEDEAELATWRTGMAALAANPRVFVKVSMLGYIRAGWTTDAAAKAAVTSLVHEAIDLFTPARVMFASNFPVDKHTTGDLKSIYEGFQEIAVKYGAADRTAMFHDTALAAYKLA